MTKTIVVLYDDIAVARQVVEDLVNADFERTSISLITNDANNRYSRYLDTDYVPREDAVTATEGAGFGAIVGVLTGALVGLAALTIPGVGLVIAAGPIMAGLTGALAGAVTGGIVGALVKSGVPEDEAPYYAEGIRRGGTLISIQTSNPLRADHIMNRYGSINIHERSTHWRQTGWKGFDVGPVEDEVTGKSSEMPTMIISDSPTMSPHKSHNAEPLPLAPSARPIFEPDPKFDDDDTEILFHESVIVKSTDQPITPLTSTSDTIEDTAVPLVLEDDLNREYEYTGDDFQAIEAIESTIDAPKG